MDAKTHAPNFWNDQEKAQQTLRQMKTLRLKLEPWLQTEKDCQGLLELVELLELEEDAETEREVETGAEKIARTLDDLEFRALLSDEFDSFNCYLHIHAGAGGTESCDWASMLTRMYSRWCEKKGFTMEELDFTPGDEAGVKSATFLIKGDYAFGYLKTEIGVHRLVRISPFDANARRHTSFASVHTTPEIDDSINIDIKEDDLRIDTYRSSGAGGQHVNRTESAVRITHLPTKIVVSCQNERSQHKNKDRAMKMLAARLYQHELNKQKEAQAVVEGEKSDIAWGSQIRSYVFQPYQMVKDLRSGHETGNIAAVMDGELDPIMESVLRWQAGMDK
jgi:peptide chain release factor 2